MKEEFPSPSDSVASYAENETVECIKSEDGPYPYRTSFPPPAHHYSHYLGSNTFPTAEDFHASIKVPYLHQQSYGNAISFPTDNKLCYQINKLGFAEEDLHYDEKTMADTPLDSNSTSPRGTTQLEVSMHELPSYEKHHNKYFHMAQSYFRSDYTDPLPPFMYSQEVPLKLETENSSSTLLPRKTNKIIQPDSSKTEPQKSQAKKELKELAAKITSGSHGDKKESNLSDSETNPEKKPPYSYVALIAKAIEASKDKKLQLNEIYTYVVNEFPYFKHLHEKGNAGWKNSIRHNLSLNECFMKIPRGEGSGGGKGHFWTVVHTQGEMFENNNFKRRRKARRNNFNTGPYHQFYNRPRDAAYSFCNPSFQYGCAPTYHPVNQLHPTMPMGSSYQPPVLPTTFSPTITANSLSSGLHSPTEFSSAFTSSFMTASHPPNIPQSGYPSTSFTNPRLPASISSTESIYDSPVSYNGPVSGFNGVESHASPSPLYYQSYDNSRAVYDGSSDLKKLSDDFSVNHISSRSPFSWSVNREKTFPQPLIT